MKIYILNPPFLPHFVRGARWQGGVSRGGTLYYPIWLSFAAGLIEKEGYSVRLVDAPAWEWNKKDVMKPWKFTSNDGRAELQLEPIHKEKVYLNLLFMGTKGVNVFGYYTGDVILDDGTKIHIDRSDKLFGSAEYFKHRW